MLRLAPTVATLARVANVASVAVCALVVSGCASPRPVLESVHGAYTTHFEGVPDRAAICAEVTNHRDVAVDWLELRLRARSEHGRRAATWNSTWVYEGPVAAGETVALELVDPPVVAAIRLRPGRSGRGARPRRGRPVRRVERCSGEWVDTTLADAAAQRTAPARHVHAIAGAQPPASPDLLAESDPR